MTAAMAILSALSNDIHSRFRCRKTMSYGSNGSHQGTLFGHPAGLFTLFFAEMWERFSYYGMRALLVFYMIKGFLGLNDDPGLRASTAPTPRWST